MTDESGRIRAELRTAETVHEQRVSELAALGALARYIQADPAETSVVAASGLVNRARERAFGVGFRVDCGTVTLYECRRRRGGRSSG